ncbi:MAG: hypothetical protein LN409_02200, partial [Candidatus Thermoplasmatota archaeon]|nr:hypothetical protein [Candidatus Thermoplasmatota archaeon]
EEISEQWKVTLHEFDKMIGEFLAPPPGAKTRPRGSRRSSQNEEDYWKKIHELHDVLRRYNVHYSLRTYERGKEDFMVGGYP